MPNKLAGSEKGNFGQFSKLFTSKALSSSGKITTLEKEELKGSRQNGLSCKLAHKVRVGKSRPPVDIA